MQSSFVSYLLSYIRVWDKDKIRVKNLIPEKEQSMNQQFYLYLYY